MKLPPGDWLYNFQNRMFFSHEKPEYLSHNWEAAGRIISYTNQENFRLTGVKNLSLPN